MAALSTLFDVLRRWAIQNPLLGTIGMIFALAVSYTVLQIYTNLIASPLRSIPGPRLFALTKWRLAYEDYRGARTRYVNDLHRKYGEVVRVGPNEISFNSLSALKTIYGAGTVFQRHRFYRMFDAYGRQNMFSVASSVAHRDRKKLLNHAYSKTVVLSPQNSGMIEDKTRKFLSLVDNDSKDGILETFNSLHYFSMDSITQFIYGKTGGATTALTEPKNRDLLDDIINSTRRKLSFFAIHFPRLTNWLYSRQGFMESVVTNFCLLPMAKPSTYTGIRRHALLAAENLRDQDLDVTVSIAARLFNVMRTQTKGPTIDHLDIASECADQFLAGIDTTSDTLMFAMFALSQRANQSFQDKLREEILTLSEDAVVDDVVSALAADKLPYLDAVIKETLRLYAPLPGTEPRWSETDEVIDGYSVPAETVVSLSPYCLHRNERVFKDPLEFNPDRWVGDPRDVAEMKKWFWAFSSGGRMCIGMHLAMAEMTTLLASVYRKYRTEIAPEFVDVTPGVTARYEVFYDERFSQMEEHTCWIRFVRV
ncbi:hypothetical protein FE257_003574 [Aspergillus nanangensis]|uniref:Cytochrome P450 n=1 Tax=Aspergillus nanangensis TaxID=2582783 RepID=A0AAD4CBT5_ASPNN|nr:hypothetical protein FE257_003574 [Aspergillus nanangensis]